MDSLDTAKKIAAQVLKAGGKTYFVGGYVRDLIMGRNNDDIDIEVHGIAPETLENILDSTGDRIEIGKSFGIYSLKGCPLDIAMPRTETAVGSGHRDFRVLVDPHLGPEKAAERRDFTMNALMQDVMTGEITDPFGGIRDIERRIIRHINPVKFAEDPLRVMRAAQFSARLGFLVAPETLDLMSRMDLKTLAKERVFDELRKALLHADRPSVFFEILRKCSQLDFWFPELIPLIDLPQDPSFHPEGSVWNHTMLVTDEAAKLRDKAENPLGLMLSAVTHDLGKAVTTEERDGHIHTYNHDIEGIPIAETFLRRLTSDKALIRYVLSMVELHMRPNLMASQRSGVKAMNRLFDSSESPGDLILMARADCLGCGRDLRASFARNSAFLDEHLKIFREVMAKPYVTGQDLVAAGIEPGTDFKEILEYAHKLRLADVDKGSALKQTVAYAQKLRKDNGSCNHEIS
ncbi:MAG: tRNA nucleotidyltransferase [Oscillospiraceae bacterium]|nr:tRNA nucleotidyltransferase [Oscillospiraceae bacterium]